MDPHVPFSMPPAQPLRAPIVFEPADRERQRMEYRVVRVDPAGEGPLDEARLNLLGIAGWLLVSVLRLPAPGGAERLDYLFVRPAD